MALVIISSLVFSFGLGFILFDLFKVPTIAMQKALNSVYKNGNSKVSSIDLWLEDISKLLAKTVKLSEYKRNKLLSNLKNANINMSPEEYIADSITRALVIAAFAIPFFFISKFISLVILIVSIYVFVNEIRKVEVKMRLKKEEIENELPRFVSNIITGLTHTRDVLGMLEAYKDSAKDALKNELNITIADMKSGNYEVALTRLEARCNSSMVSDVTRGLISIIRGDDVLIYFENLKLKFKDYERQKLKNRASVIPKKVKRLSFALLVCFVLIYVVVIYEVLVTSLGGLI